MSKANEKTSYRVVCHDAFIQIFSWTKFEVTDRVARPKRLRKNQSSDDAANIVEAPLLHPISSRWDQWTGEERVSLTSLRPDTTFTITVQDSTSSTTTLRATTTNHCNLLDARDVLTETHFQNLAEDELIETIVVHPSDWMVALVDWKNKRQTLKLLSKLYYEGLFSLASSRHDFLLSLPNGQQRYGIDFTTCSPGCWTSSRKVRRLVDRLSSSDSVQRTSSLRVAVNKDFGATLKAAEAYHTQNGSTWLTPQLMAAMELLSAVGSQHGVRLCAVELWDIVDDQEKLLAGCLGFAVGSVYHDFTMFTNVRSHHSYGTLITKILGSALEDCGYRLWYWGFRVAYMEHFEAGCGARNWDRNEFYQLWATHRTELPIWHVQEYLNHGKGLIRSLLGPSGPPATT